MSTKPSLGNGKWPLHVNIELHTDVPFFFNVLKFQFYCKTLKNLYLIEGKER